MAIAPIDLQVMYAQMHNVAKIAVSQQQGTVLSQQLQEQKVIQQNLEKAEAVKKAADSEAKTMLVNNGSRGGGGGAEAQSGGKKNTQSDVPLPSEKKQEIKESYLGQHIDLLR